MNKKINHWCIICGQGYHACDSCEEVKTLQPWKRFTCTSNHYQIRLVIDDFVSKVINKEQAYAMLKKCDLKGWEDFPDNVKKVIKEINTYKEVVEESAIKADKKMVQIVPKTRKTKQEVKQ